MSSNKVIAVLGRGPSLIRYKEFSDQFEKIYISNDFKVEVGFLGMNHFLNKEVVHICGNSKANFLTPDLYKQLKIDSIRCNAFYAHQYLKLGKGLTFLKIIYLDKEWWTRGYPPVPWKEIIKYIDQYEYDELCVFLENKYKSQIEKEKIAERVNILRAWPTTGLLAIDKALFENNPEAIYLFGFDCYGGDYLVKKNPYPHQTYEWEKSKMMRYHLKHLVKEFSNTLFYSSHNLDWDLKNWNNL